MNKWLIDVATEKVWAPLEIGLRRRNEISKFKDSRRVAILSKVTLTRDQEAAIDSLYRENYGRTIPHTWHRYFQSYTGRFDETYFPELLFIPEYEYYMNSYRYKFAYSDKNFLPLLCCGMRDVRTPTTLLSCAGGIYRDGSLGFMTDREAVALLGTLGEVFVKPSIDSNSGDDCFVMDFTNGTDRISGISAHDVLQYYGHDLVVQERIKCHPLLSAIYPDSVNTFRVITYRWNGHIFHTPTILRIGQGGHYLDNVHSGGMFVAVSDDGQLHEKAFTEFQDVFLRHPNTGTLFDGYSIPQFSTVLHCARELHYRISQVGIVHWDFTLDTEGTPVLIEANIRSGSIWLPQMAHGCGAFGQHTAEILRWLKDKRERRHPLKHWPSRRRRGLVLPQHTTQ